MKDYVLYGYRSMATLRLIHLPCTFCGALVPRFPSQQINPKTSELRKIVKCKDCRRVDPEILFWRMVKKEGHFRGCWEWTGAQAQGYGQFPWKDLGEYRSHRISWRLAHNKEPIPKGQGVLHKRECHNRSCVNPDHLYLGNQSQNGKDSVANGTHPSFIFKGEKNWNSKLTDAGATRILKEYSRGTVKQLAAELGVSIATVRDVWRCRSWKHLPRPLTQP